MLTGQKALVTGATGFIGGRLVEKLVLEHRVQVRALVHNFTNAARIARFGPDDLEMIAGDITDSEVVERAVSGCDVVFHLAHDTENLDRNVTGIRLLAEACLRNGVRRLVHTSSIAVYEPFPDGDLDESTMAKPSGWGYGDCKLAEEDEILRYASERGLPATIILPTMVYGPYGKRWTATPMNQVQNGQVYLPDGGQGLCNPVYVDDVVDGMILASDKDAAIGERFIISGPTPVTWKEFFSSFEQLVGVTAQVHMSRDEINNLNRSILQNLRLTVRDPVRLMSWTPLRRLALHAIRWPMVRNALKRLRDALGDEIIGKLMSRRLYIPRGQVLDLYQARCHIKIDKARQILGYEPKFGFKQGMELTGGFIRWAYLGQSNTSDIPVEQSPLQAAPRPAKVVEGPENPHSHSGLNGENLIP